MRDLKNRATQVVRLVREQGAEHVLTVAGEPVAVPRPRTRDDDESRRRREMLSELEALDLLAKETAARWSSEKTAREILADVRDESW